MFYEEPCKRSSYYAAAAEDEVPPVPVPVPPVPVSHLRGKTAARELDLWEQQETDCGGELW